MLPFFEYSILQDSFSPTAVAGSINEFVRCEGQGSLTDDIN